MKIVQINSVCGSGSTGKICVAISELLTAKDIENHILYAVGNSNYPLRKRYMSSLEVKCQALKSKLFGNYGFQSKAATKRLIRELENFSPDIVHLHNLHSHNVHLGMLLRYLKEKKIKIFWTFHDCWAFTGYCMYYDMAGCDRWEIGCHSCPQRKHYSWLFDRSKYLFNQKKTLFSDLDLTIITPSQWLADQVKQSFLKDYRVKVIHNGIDLSVFYPRESDFRKRYHLEDKFVILGVAMGWEKRKGLDVFIELANRLDTHFQIVLVGTNDKIDKQLPENILSIHRTQNQAELAEIYSAANVFVNPTREDNVPTVNLEALACGTPVVTFNAGGSAESVAPGCGFVLPYENVEGLIAALQGWKNAEYSQNACIGRAKQFESNLKYAEYIALYMEYGEDE